MSLETVLLHIVTVATQKNRHLERLEASCKNYKLPLEILGMGDTYKAHGKKITLVRQFIDQLPDEDIVLYVDAYDVVFLDDLQAIKNTFLEMNVPLVFAAESTLSSHHQYKWKNRLLTYLNYPKSQTIYRYLNAGTFMGRIKACKTLFDAVDIKAGDICDQGKFSEYFVANASKITLDYHQKIFSCNGGRGGLEDQDYCIKDGNLFAKKTKSYPKVLHITGKLFMPLDTLSRDLGIYDYTGHYSDFDKKNLVIRRKANRKHAFFNIEPKLYFFLEKVFLYLFIVLLIIMGVLLFR